MPGTLTVSGLSAGDGQVTVGPVTTTGLNTLVARFPVNLTTGDNTIAVPAGSVAVEIELGQAPAVTVKVRSNLNPLDGGVAISPVAGTPWYKQDLPSGQTSVILNSSGSLPNVMVTFI